MGDIWSMISLLILLSAGSDVTSLNIEDLDLGRAHAIRTKQAMTRIRRASLELDILTAWQFGIECTNGIRRVGHL